MVESPHVIFVVTCIDRRLHKAGAFASLAEKQFGKEAYIASSAGGAKALADPPDPAKRIAILLDIGLVKELVGIDTVVIADHDAKCAAYRIDDLKTEEQAHRENLERAAEVVQASFPDLRVILAMTRIGPDDKLQQIEVLKEVPPKTALA